ncbi:MAG: hypothetical protein QOF48_1616 [Verrucomicrobiota bacterium]
MFQWHPAGELMKGFENFCENGLRQILLEGSRRKTPAHDFQDEWIKPLDQGARSGFIALARLFDPR